MAANSCYIGIDLGTTGVKVGGFDASGNVLGFSRRGFTLDQPAPDFVEFDVNVFYDCVSEALVEVLAQVAERSSHVAGIGLSSQAQTFVLLDDSFQPLRPAISWLDTRAQGEANELSELSLREVGRPVDAIASGPKLLWIARHEPDVFARCRYVALLPDYVVLRLTGKRVTGLRSAESTGCYDLRIGDWIEPLLSHCKLTRAMMPEVGAPCAVAGWVHDEAAQRFGLPEGIPVAVGAMDHLAGAMGTGNSSAGIGSAALGTALAVVTGTSNEPKAVPGVAVRPHPIPRLFALLSYSKTAGIVLDWCRNQLAPDMEYEELLSEASQVSPGSDGVMCFPHFAGMASPTFDPQARGAFTGLALHHSRAHLMRAVVEALCFLMRENLERLEKAGGEIRILRVTGGGARSDFWLQAIADVCNVTVERPKISEAPCFGAAQFAMVAAGAFESEAAACERLYAAERVFTPEVVHREIYEVLYQRFVEMHDRLYAGRS